MYYINYFFIFSIIGHIIESFFYKNGNGGILIGYWTPVYGVGVIVMIIIDKFIQKLNINTFSKIVLLFAITAIILSSLEVLAGYVIKWVFNTELWNYTNHKFNIGKYTSLEMDAVWGFGSIILIYIIKPLIDKIINKIPSQLTYILVILFILDISASLLLKSKWINKLTK